MRKFNNSVKSSDISPLKLSKTQENLKSFFLGTVHISTWISQQLPPYQFKICIYSYAISSLTITFLNKQKNNSEFINHHHLHPSSHLQVCSYQNSILNHLDNNNNILQRNLDKLLVQMPNHLNSMCLLGY